MPAETRHIHARSPLLALYATGARHASVADLKQSCAGCGERIRQAQRVASLPGGGVAHVILCCARAANGGKRTWAEVIAEAKLTFRCPVHDRNLAPAGERAACPSRGCKVSVSYA